MKQIFTSIVSFATSFAITSVVTFSAQAQPSGQCTNLFRTYDPNPAKREVLLEPGEQIWGTYVCRGCDSTVSARPTKRGIQECPNCGTKPHTNQQYSPPETIERGGRLYLVEPGNLITEGDGTGYLARSGKGWTCGFCSSVNFQVQLECKGCGNPKEEILEPPKSAAYEDYMRDQRPSGVSGAVKSGIASAERLVEAAKSISVQKPGAPASFLRTKAGALLMTATAVGAAGFIWWGTETYTLPAQVTSVTPDTAYVSYKDKDGQSVTIDITPPDKSVSIQDWRVGDKVTLYFRNLGGAKAAEGFDGKVLVPKKK